MNLALWQWALIAVVVLVNLGMWAGPVFSFLGGLKLPSIGASRVASTSAIPSRREVIDQLDSAFTFFDSINCQEGRDAVKLAVQHAFSHKEAEAKA